MFHFRRRVDSRGRHGHGFVQTRRALEVRRRRLLTGRFHRRCDRDKASEHGAFELETFGIIGRHAKRVELSRAMLVHQAKEK